MIFPSRCLELLLPTSTQTLPGSLVKGAAPEESPANDDSSPSSLAGASHPRLQIVLLGKRQQQGAAG